VDTSGSDFDTVLSVFEEGTPGASPFDILVLPAIAQNDDCTGVGLQSCVTFTALAGVVYSIVVDGFDESKAPTT
jgi:hypothetical protein